MSKIRKTNNSKKRVVRKSKVRTAIKSTKKINQKPKFNFSFYTPKILMIVGVFLVSLSGIHWYFRYQSLSLSKELLASYEVQQQIDEGLTPTKIYIQWFVDVNIETQFFSDNQWTISENFASYLYQSSKPTQKGNIIIYGHNTRKILGNIRALKGNEIITITTKNGEEHKYQIFNIDEVNPDEVDYLKPTSEEILTLYTCSGFLDSKRFIVQAKPML